MSSGSVVPDVVECSAEALLSRHLSRAKEWFPHQLTPWGEGRELGADGGESVLRCLPDGAASALWVGLLTEDNLPHYYHAVATEFAPDSVMGEWTRQWAAEEQRHAIVIRDWVCITRTLDLVALERARMRQVRTGFAPGERARSLSDGLVYLTLQELATRISHWNTGEMLDPAGKAVMRRVAVDENLHYLFYRDLVTAALEADPSGVVKAIDRQISEFSMPGSSIDDFARHATAIAAAGVYDFKVHYEEVLLPVVLKQWHIEEIEGLDSEASKARDHALALIARLRRIAARMEAQQAET